MNDWGEHRIIVGDPNALVDQLGQLGQIGIYRVMLQWLDLDDIDGLETLALPHLAA